MKFGTAAIFLFLLANFGLTEEISPTGMAEDEMDFLVKYMMLPYYQRLHDLQREKEELESQYKSLKQGLLQFTQSSPDGANEDEIAHLPQISLDFVVNANDELRSTDEQEKLYKIYMNKLNIRNKEKEIQEFEQEMTTTAQELKRSLL